MNSKQFRLILVGLLALSAIIFLSICFLGISALSSQSQKMVDLKLKNKTAEAQLANLELAKKEVDKYSYFKDIAHSVLPNDKDQAQAVLEIFDIANQAGISLQNVTFPSSNLGVGATATTGASGASTPSTAPASKTISQALPVTGIPGLYSMQLNITPATGSQVAPDRQVTYSKMLDFLRKIENNRRTAQITQVNIQPGTQGSDISFNISVNIFIKP
jgi:ABC-type transport system involved in multi-copper enzyme maturation permease subunit